MIKVKNLSKVYEVPVLEKGFLKNLKHIFSRNYKTINALKSISFDIEEGSITGVLGANGAGKSTLIKILTGVITPSSGTISVNGFTPSHQSNEFKKSIGAVFGQRSQLWWDIGVMDSFNMIKYIYKIPDDIFNTRLNDLISLLDISSLLNQPVRTLSLGQKMKCDIVASMLHNPKILFLDEPTIGLDVNTKIKFREILHHLNSNFKTTILITSHDMHEIEKICSNLVVIKNGALIFSGEIENFMQSMNPSKYISLEFNEIISNDFLTYIKNKNISYTLTNASNIKLHFSNLNQVNINAFLSETLSNFEIINIQIEDESFESIISNVI